MNTFKLSEPVPATKQAGAVRVMLVDMETLTCPTCGCLFGATVRFVSQRRSDGLVFFCLNGHPQSFKETEVDRVRKELAQAISQLDQLVTYAREQREAKERTDRQFIAAKGRVTKLKNRIAGGACPCCNRFFAELASHMKTQHPTFRDDEAGPD